MKAKKTAAGSFYSENSETGKTTISHLGLLTELKKNGYARAKISEDNYLLVKVADKKLKRATEGDLVSYLHKYLEENNEFKALETLIKGISSYINNKKLYFLPSIDVGNDMDNEFSSKFFFANKIISVSKDKLVEIAYTDYPNYIWEERLFTHSIGDRPEETGQFEQFCYNISGQDDVKFLRFKSIVGYLLHRHKNPALAKAIIFYDEKMNDSGQAEGGTGKTLITLALKHCRNVVVFNGKEVKENSWFRNQRIEVTTDIMAYDDVKKDFDFATLFPVITTAIEVEKKRQQAFEIPFENSPKVVISSNHYVKGPGGSSDRRRRCEFELTNYYSEKHSPEDDFGNLFFSQWDQFEWDKFYYFMMECVQVFLVNSLIKGNDEIEKNRRLENLTSPEFVEAVEGLSKIGEWVDQRDLIELLKTEIKDLTAHTFTKWMTIYCDENELKQEKKSSAGNYFYRLIKNN